MLPATAASYTGQGFDACTAPSAAVMKTWLRLSPYRAVGIYLGGADRACAQPNLTAGWVRLQQAAGWHFMPIYVGPQASFGQQRIHQYQGGQNVSYGGKTVNIDEDYLDVQQSVAGTSPPASRRPPSPAGTWTPSSPGRAAGCGTSGSARAPGGMARLA